MEDEVEDGEGEGQSTETMVEKQHFAILTRGLTCSRRGHKYEVK